MRKRADNNAGGIEIKLEVLPMPCRNEAIISANETDVASATQEDLTVNVVSLNYQINRGNEIVNRQQTSFVGQGAKRKR